jgi:hypothetical protein
MSPVAPQTSENISVTHSIYANRFFERVTVRHKRATRTHRLLSDPTQCQSWSSSAFLQREGAMSVEFLIEAMS